MQTPKIWLILALFCCLTPLLTGLEIQRGKIKIQINESNGRVSVYYTDDLASPSPIPLWAAEDATTSKMKIQLSDKIYTLGDDSNFRLKAEAIPTGARLTWTSSFLLVTQSYEFLTSQGASLPDGVKVTINFVNPSDTATIRPALRVVFDTYLGEKKEHFRLGNGDSLNSETKIEGNLPDWWLSPSASDEKIGLLMMLGKGASVPSKVIFANWKRLDDTNWDVTVRPGRDFNLLPYSYNDSAIAQYYEGQELAPGAGREIVLLFGNRSAVTFAGAKVGSADALSDLLQGSQTKDSKSSPIVQDLQSVENIIDQINAKLANPAQVSEDELKLIKAILDQLEARQTALKGTAAASGK